IFVLNRERNFKNLVKATSATQKQINLVKLHEQSKKNLEGEIQSYKNEAQKQRKIIYQLEKERDCFINDNNELKQKVGTVVLSCLTLRTVKMLIS
uniref:Cilia- and flagella-associated protein 58 central coiled coil domain-containing protein n=1 Tax=Strix occidentalis caurina TaxID=311401 RepID=A0A8D0EP68_STROC